MKHLTLDSFWQEFDTLPESVQSKARKCFILLKTNVRHPSLHFKKIKVGNEVWSVRIDQDYRALAFEDEDKMVWFWIGKHAVYDKKLK